MGVVLRQSFKATIVSYVGAILGYVNLVFLYPLCLSPEQYGLTRIIVEVATILAFFSQMGISNAVVRFFPKFNNLGSKHHGFLFYITIIPLCGFLFFGISFVLFKTTIVNAFGKNSALFLHYFYYVLPITFFIMYITVSEAYSSVMMRIVIPKISKEIILRLIIALVVISFYFKLLNQDGLIAGFVLAYGIATLFNVFYIIKIQESSFVPDKTVLTKQNKKEMGVFLLYMLAAGLGTSVVSKIDTFMIASQLDLAAAGVFSLAFFMAMIIEMPSRSLLQILSPIASKALSENNMVELNVLYKKSSINQMLFATILFIFIWINIDSIFEIMPNGNIYKAGKWVIFFIGLSKVFDAATGINVVIIGNSKYYYFGLLLVVLLAISAIALNYLLIPIYGITGAAIATASSILLYNTAYVWFVWLQFKLHPFTGETIKTIAMFTVIVIINYFMPTHYFHNSFANAFIRSSLVFIVLLYVTYTWKISVDFNEFMLKLIKMRKIKHIQNL